MATAHHDSWYNGSDDCFLFFIRTNTFFGILTVDELFPFVTAVLITATCVTAYMLIHAFLQSHIEEVEHISYVPKTLAHHLAIADRLYPASSEHGLHPW